MLGRVTEVDATDQLTRPGRCESGSHGCLARRFAEKNRTPESNDPGKANIGKFIWDAAIGFAVPALGH
jgi:hypothetical protein